jgi:predicted permease
VLAHEYWTREFGADPGAIGSSIDIDQGRYTIVGIAPRGFTGAGLEPVDIWVPLQTAQAIENGREWTDNRGWYWLRTVARLGAGATPEGAALEATAAHRAGRQASIADDEYDEGAEIIVAPIIAAQGPSPTSEARVARLLAGVSLVVLLIACFNVANLLLARAVHARREVAVRLALGSGRGRLVLELVVESLMLAALGAAAAALVARGIGSTVHQALLPNVAFEDGGLSARVLGFTVLTTLIAGLATGLIPAFQSSRTDLVEALRAGGRGIASGRSRTRTALLIGQAGLSVVLLVGAGLFIRSLREAQTQDLGFDAQRVAVMTLEWNETLPGPERQAVYVDVAERLRRLPGIRSVGLTYTVPFRSSISLGQPRVPGLDSIPKHHDGGPYVNKVSSGYFEAMGLSILQGRGIEPSDDAASAPPVAVVSESMARAIWPAGDALGACMQLERDDDTCTEVVGVVENHRRQALVEDDPHFMYYVNQEHPAFTGPPQALMIGTAGDPAASLDGLRQEARASSSQIRFVGLVSLSDYVEPEMQAWKLGASMFSVFGALALIVAAWGLYCVLAFDVALRRHELGVRAALGAGMPRIVRLVLRQALTLVGIGTALGLLGATIAARFIEPLLFHVSGTDAITFAVVAATLMTVAGLAGSLPAWRATQIDPREALQAD